MQDLSDEQSANQMEASGAAESILAVQRVNHGKKLALNESPIVVRASPFREKLGDRVVQRSVARSRALAVCLAELENDVCRVRELRSEKRLLQ